MATPIFAWRRAAPKCQPYVVYLEQAQIRYLGKDFFLEQIAGKQGLSASLFIYRNQRSGSE